MRIVLDTNVLVSGLLNRHGNPAFVLRLLLQRAIEVALDERILAEYDKVLSRPKFGLIPEERTTILRELRAVAIRSGLPQRPATLPDPDDRIFLEVAFATNADAIVTGNFRHFPADICAPVRIIAPAEFMRLWGELNQE